LVLSGPAHWTGATPAESIDIADTLEAILASARSEAIVSLAPLT
jgi:D-xylose 1-dehydrogenase (NADP+, D-xylono-1,5-lactone-forming)